MTPEIAAYKVERKGWPAGPWDNEPDYEQWTTRSGLPGLIVRNRLGALCGYAALFADHQAYGKKCDDVDVEAHGGLTYSGKCSGHICHVPQPGQPDDVYWFGFDCSHAFDLSPGMHASLRQHGAIDLLPRAEWETYRDMAYVRAEVEQLAEQLAAMRDETGEDK